MVLPGHLSAGFLTTTSALSLLSPDLSTNQLTSLYIIGTLAGDFPDIDIFVFNILQKIAPRNDRDHRDFFTHAPIVWLVVSILIFLLGYLFNSLYTEILALIVFLGSWSHLVLDSIEYGVMWFWPISRQRHALSKNPPKIETTAPPGSAGVYIDFIKNVYFKTWTFWAEAGVTLIAVMVLCFKFLI